MLKITSSKFFKLTGFGLTIFFLLEVPIVLATQKCAITTKYDVTGDSKITQDDLDVCNACWNKSAEECLKCNFKEQGECMIDIADLETQSSQMAKIKISMAVEDLTTTSNIVGTKGEIAVSTSNINDRPVMWYEFWFDFSAKDKDGNSVEVDTNTLSLEYRSKNPAWKATVARKPERLSVVGQGTTALTDGLFGEIEFTVLDARIAELTIVTSNVNLTSTIGDDYLQYNVSDIDPVLITIKKGDSSVADLSVTDIAFYRDYTALNSHNILVISYCNIGTKKMQEAEVGVAWEVNNVTKTDSILSLNLEESECSKYAFASGINQAVITEPGYYNITVKIDTADVIEEADETNNTLTKNIYFEPYYEEVFAISNIKVKAGLTTATITWNTNFASNSSVYYYYNQGDKKYENWNWDKIDDYTEKEHIVILSNLKPGTVYYYTVSSLLSQSTNKITSDLKSFTTASEESDNQPPVIIKISGPMSLKVHETGYWSIIAKDPDNNNLTYKVDWGEKTIAGGFSTEISQKSSFSHSYSQGGDYTITYTVSDDEHLSDTTSLIVTVSGYNKDCTNEYKPVCGANGATYSNRCIAGINNAKIVYEGKCRKEYDYDKDKFKRYKEPDQVRSKILRLQRRISKLEQRVIDLEKKLVKKIDQALVNRVKGRILLQVEKAGEAWYVEPQSENKFYMRNGRAAYDMMRALGLGITNQDLEKIPIGIQEKIFDLKDSDGDGIPDRAEWAIGTDSNKPDTDGDGYNDKAEILNGYKPNGQDKYAYDQKLTNRLKGRILLQVESKGEAWYVNPADNRRYYLGDPESAFNVMRFLSLGITNDDLRQIQVGELAD